MMLTNWDTVAIFAKADRYAKKLGNDVKGLLEDTEFHVIMQAVPSSM